MPDKRYTKVEEEVIQILDRLEKEQPAPSRPNLRLLPTKQAQRRPRYRISLPRLGRRPSWIWLAAAFGLAFLAILVNDTSHTLAVLVAIASILAFFAPVVLERRPVPPGSGPIGTKTWRGRDIAFDSQPGDTAADRARRWLDRRRGGPRR